MVDLGTLKWVYANADTEHARFYVDFTAIAPNPSTEKAEILCPIYLTDTTGHIYGHYQDKTIGASNGALAVYDTDYTSAADFKAAMSGVMLDYPLAAPLTYKLDTPLPTDLTCVQGDILQRVSDNNCPFVGEMRFGL